jgi:CrcB protein
MKICAMMLAGALGVLARYGLSVGIQEWVGNWGGRTFLGASFPLGTLVINVCGSLLLSFLTALVLAGAVKPEWRLILGTGFLGAFTTFSTFELESEHLLAWGQWKAAGVYVAGNLLLGFGAILLGRFLATRVLALVS